MEKMQPLSFRLNQYNWYGQKLLTQHRYSDVLRLRDCISAIRAGASATDESTTVQSKLISDHLSYLDGLALLKRSFKLDELIVRLQKLDFQKNNQHFLLLCQCLLYLGNYDAVVALFRQTLNEEIYIVSEKPDNKAIDHDLVMEMKTSGAECARNSSSNSKEIRESTEFANIYENVCKNRLINDPRLWYIFSRCLKLQLKYVDAELALRMASKLAISRRNEPEFARQSRPNSDTVLPEAEDIADLMEPATLNNFNPPHLEYTDFCINFKNADYKSALQALSQASSCSPINRRLQPLLALILSCQPNSNFSHFNKALELIDALDAHSDLTQNPSFVYNQLALKCKQKLHQLALQTDDRLEAISDNCADAFDDVLSENDSIDEFRSSLDYLLIKSHIIINNCVQNSSHDPNAYRCSSITRPSTNNQTYHSIDKLIDSLKICDPMYWSSYSLLNNLGVCYLMKRRYIASLSCLLRAQQLNAHDWRVSYNLGLALLHVGAFQRAIVSLSGSQNLKAHQIGNPHRFKPECDADRGDTFGQMLQAICLSQLNAPYQSKRLYSEMVVRMKKKTSNPLVAPIVNYVLFLARQQTCELDRKLMLRLLEFLEHAWLQRNQNDAQFNDLLLELAGLIGESAHKKDSNRSEHDRKRFAWMMVQKQIS